MSELDEINRDVWLPFQRAYARLDIESFVAVRHADLIRVEIAGRWIGDLDGYRERTSLGFDPCPQPRRPMNCDPIS